MRWISDVGVRWGREGGVDGGEGVGDGDGGGGVLGGVVEMERVESGGVMVGGRWWRRWRGRLLGLEFSVKMCDFPHTAECE